MVPVMAARVETGTPGGAVPGARSRPRPQASGYRMVPDVVALRPAGPPPHDARAAGPDAKIVDDERPDPVQWSVPDPAGALVLRAGGRG